MAKGLIEDSTLTAIAGAIRTKTNTTDTMTPSEMAAKIAGITGTSKMTYGSQTIPTYATTHDTMTIEHYLGVVPNVIYICLAGDNSLTTLNRIMLSVVLWADGTGSICYINFKSEFVNLPINSSTISNYITTLDSTTLTVHSPDVAKYPLFKTTYYWFAGVKE